MKTVGVVTGTRADFGIYRPVLRAIEASPSLELRLMVCGGHLSARFGHTIDDIVAEGFTPAERLETLDDDDSPAGIARSTSNGIARFAEAYARQAPDVLLVLGDRYEMFAAAIAAMPFNIPVAHIHGGELTEGLIDEAIRHSLTKMSQYHFVSTETYAKRVIQMGEMPKNVHVTGAPSLDEVAATPLIDAADLRADLGIETDGKPLLVTYHPVTLEYEDTARHMEALIAALDELDNPIVFTYPNADTHGRIIIDAIEAFRQRAPNVVAVKSLGTKRYFSLMASAAAMVGNSSSGIVEAASFKLPVVNIGNRQKGRLRDRNVIDVGYTADEIRSGLRRAMSPAFARGLDDLTNSYGRGDAAQRIVAVLERIDISSAALKKPFHDIDFVD